MDDLHERASQLRAAALTFQHSAENLRTVVDQTDALMDDLNVATDSPASDSTFARYQHQRGWLHEWAATVHRFAGSLNEAADQIDASVGQQDHHSDPQAQPHSQPYAEPAAVAPPAPDPVHHHPYRPTRPVWIDRLGARYQPNQVTDYLSAFNQARYQQMQFDQQVLPSRMAALAHLADQRDTAALTVRMLSEHSVTDASLNVELARQTEHLSDLNTQHDHLAGEITRLRQEIDTINARLQLITPEAGANLSLIRTMEGHQSPDWLQNNTFDCVRYIVSRVNVPPDIARDAYLWDDQAAQLDQYGIRTGTVPLPGSILVMERDHPYADPRFGHVMLVDHVDPDGSIWITDNLHPNTPVLLQTLTDQILLKVKYLYLPWFTRA
ncbi:MAG: CHAP domain-containing protein [Anaerolineae bacterium]